MAATGHAGTQAPQSMHSSGWMYIIVAASYSGSSLRGWMQSTGQTSTQAVSLVSMQGSVMMKGMLASLRRKPVLGYAPRPFLAAEPRNYTPRSRVRNRWSQGPDLFIA